MNRHPSNRAPSTSRSTPVEGRCLHCGARETPTTPKPRDLVDQVRSLREVPSDSPWRPTIHEET
jgi:hypothetical protein